MDYRKGPSPAPQTSRLPVPLAEALELGEKIKRMLQARTYDPALLDIPTRAMHANVLLGLLDHAATKIFDRMPAKRAFSVVQAETMSLIEEISIGTPKHPGMAEHTGFLRQVLTLATPLPLDKPGPGATTAIAKTLNGLKSASEHAQIVEEELGKPQPDARLISASLGSLIQQLEQSREQSGQLLKTFSPKSPLPQLEV